MRYKRKRTSLTLADYFKIGNTNKAFSILTLLLLSLALPVTILLVQTQQNSQEHAAYDPNMQPSVRDVCQGLIVSTPIRLDSTRVSYGSIIRGSVTYANVCPNPVSVQDIAITAKMPTGGDADFIDLVSTVALQPGQSITVHASRVMKASDPAGQWYAFSKYQDEHGLWHSDVSKVYFRMTSSLKTTLNR